MYQVSVLFQDTITVFNYHKSTGFWYPTVINNAHIESANSVTHGTTGNTNADSVKVSISSTSEKSVRTPEEIKSYTEPKAFAATENPGGCITFTPECDFFYVGTWGDLMPVDDDDYDEGFYHAMNRENDGVYMVSSVAYFRLIPHFEIGGR